jgi:RND family efflux transporter MFP subunit
MDIQFELAEDQLAAANLQYEVARAQLDAARLAVGQAHTQLEKATIIASVNGTVALVTVDEGDTVSPAVTAFHLIDLSSMLLTVQVDEIDVADVKPGLKAIIDVDGLPNLPIEGIISRIGALPTMEAGVIVYDVEIEFQVPEDTGLKVGMSATADIIIDKRENVLLVPARAIGRDSQGKAVVEVVAGDDQTEIRQVTTGLSDGFQTEILSGLEEGEFIIERRSRSGTSAPGFF